MGRECRYCAERFETTNKRRVFCSDRCKVRYNREDLSCFYCGETANTRDHITPVAVDSWKRLFGGRDYVNCCQECNMLMSSDEPFNLERRMGLLISRFIRKHKLHTDEIDWKDVELEELGYSLKTYIKGRINRHKNNLIRMRHMELRLMQVIAEGSPFQEKEKGAE